MTVKKKTAIRAIAFGAAALLIAGVIAVGAERRAKAYRAQIDALYREQAATLSNTLCELDYALQKSAYAVTPYQSVTLASDVRQKAALAKTALDALPIPAASQAQISKFLAQTGDYAFITARKILADEKVGDDERENLRRLAARASELSAFLTRLQEQALAQNASGDAFTALLQNSVAFAQKEPDEAVSALAEQPGEETQTTPALIYDGPFSDNVFSRTSVFVTDLPAVDEAQALRVAAYALGTDVSTPQRGEIVDGAAMRTIPFTAGDASVLITENGGYCHSFSKPRAVQQAVLSPQDALEKAQDELSRLGYDGMTSTYYYIENNILTANFAYRENGVTCYPDLIKVGVALDDGAAVFLDASAYLTNHASRTLTPAITRAQALATVSDALQITSDAYAVIPTAGGYEKFCYELRARADDGTDLLLYIDAQTGKEAQFLILLQDDNGVLTV